jgi:tRNA A-37 threonylcarbamoyl transferase component Bud32
MAFLDIHPEYRELLARQGLRRAGDFLALQGVVCCGHLDRHVAQVTLGTGTEMVRAFLKREHRTRWRDRWAGAWAGFGFVSKSRREFAMLRSLEATDIGSPQAIAAGEDDDGRAFLLVREAEGCQDLRQVLRPVNPAPQHARRDLARQLGAALARLHRTGFAHPDLYSKHVLVRQNSPPGSQSICFLDWQRVRRRTGVNWARRWSELAALDATLADELASPRERLLVLKTYLLAFRSRHQRRAGWKLRTAAEEIRRRSLRLLERRRIREIRQTPLAAGTQNLIWLDGEALQVTREFRDELGGQIPPWLSAKKVSGPFAVKTVLLPGSRFAHFVTRSVRQPWRMFWAWMMRRSLVAPELESMKVIFRLQRYGVVLPRLLAAGQENVKPWQIQSFLLTEPLKETVPLPRFLREADQATRREAIRRAGQVLRQMHQATCYVEDGEYQAVSGLLTVCCQGSGRPAVALATVHGIEKSSCPNPVRAWRDLAALAQALAGACTRTDLLRGFLGYIDRPGLGPGTKRFARRVLQRLATPRRKRRIAA